MKATTRRIFADSSIKPEQVEGISFCSQAQGLVLVDKDGVPVHRAFSYMDQRATQEIKEGLKFGLQIEGANVGRLLTSLAITGAAPLSVKDPLWKYNWLKKNEPENFSRVYKWLDVKEYLIARMTGEFVLTHDSAFGTMLYDLKHKCISKKMCKMFGINPKHLPRLIASTDCAGELTDGAAEELGLVKGIKVFGGGMDANLIGVGAGSTAVGDTHIYSGTSGWVGTITEKPQVDVSSMIAAVVAAQPGKYNYFAELETSGKCFEWVKDHLVLDEPSAGLDPRSRNAVFKEIMSLHKSRGIAIVLVTHSMEEAVKYADRLLVINAGKVLFDGTPAEIFKEHVAELVEVGVDVPQVYKLADLLRQSGVALPENIKDDVSLVKAIKKAKGWK